MKVLRINGQERRFRDDFPATVKELLEQLNVDAATVVAEVDGVIVGSDAFATAGLSSGQNVELIRFVGGG